MFAKPHWFRTKSFNHGMTPVCWQGWLYVAGAAALLLLPSLLLLGRRQGFEALIWLAAIGTFLAFELWQVRRQLLGRCAISAEAVGETSCAPAASRGPAADEGIYFLDQRDAGQRANTARFHLSLKQ